MARVLNPPLGSPASASGDWLMVLEIAKRFSKLADTVSKHLAVLRRVETESLSSMPDAPRLLRL